VERELKRRYDLIPDLRETVKGYAAHERVWLRTVVEARARAMATVRSPAQHAPPRERPGSSPRAAAGRGGGYPRLKAHRHFLELQKS